MDTFLRQVEQSRLCQPFLTGEVFQPSEYFCGPPLEPLQQVHVFPVLGDTELDTGLQEGCHESGVEGQNLLPLSPGHTSF